MKQRLLLSLVSLTSLLVVGGCGDEPVNNEQPDGLVDVQLDGTDGSAQSDVTADSGASADAGADADGGSDALLSDLADAESGDSDVAQGDTPTETVGDISVDGPSDVPTDSEGDTPPDVAWPDVAPKHRAAFLWHGMDHEWLRTIVGFKIPHRVSKLDSFIDGELHDAPTWTGAATFNFGQSTGVDGNYMKPTGRYNALYSPDLYVTRGSTQLQWTDDSEGDTHPKAVSTQDSAITISLDVPELAHGLGDTYQALLRGVQLQTSCDDAKQPSGSNPCNSDGMWPYRMGVALLECTRDGLTLTCPLEVQINRAWTPNLGGLPPVEEKPYNDRLDFDLTVHYTIIGGASSAVNIVHGAETTSSGEARDNDPVIAQPSIQGAAGYDAGALGLTAFSFGFAKLASQTAPKFDHLGRYIGRLRFEVASTSYEPTTGAMDYEFASQVWVPDTVANAEVTYTHRAALIQLASPDANVSTPATTTGVICRNSTDQAPFFSAWEKCDEADKGPAQADDSTPISAP